MVQTDNANGKSWTTQTSQFDDQGDIVAIIAGFDNGMVRESYIASVVTGNMTDTDASDQYAWTTRNSAYVADTGALYITTYELDNGNLRYNIFAAVRYHKPMRRTLPISIPGRTKPHNTMKLAP